MIRGRRWGCHRAKPRKTENSLGLIIQGAVKADVAHGILVEGRGYFMKKLLILVLMAMASTLFAQKYSTDYRRAVILYKMNDGSEVWVAKVAKMDKTYIYVYDC